MDERGRVQPRLGAWVRACALVLAVAGALAGGGARAGDEASGGARVEDGRSLYQLHMALTDQDGQAVGLDHFRGSPVIVSLFYASCPSACPLLIHDLQALEGRMSPKARAATRVLLVSLDPETDTPALLKAAATRYHVDESRWRLTRADEARVRELAAVLGIKYRREAGGAISHTSRLTLLDGAGVPVSFIEGLGQPGDGLLAELERLVGGAAP